MTLMLAVLVSALAQEGTLDLLDGETLYDGGWLFTLGAQLETREGLSEGSDPLERKLTEITTSVSAHYGLRHDLQISAILPYVSRELESNVGDVSSSGIGDFAAVAKWRFYRWDEVGAAANFALIAGLETPTGDDDVEDSGVRLPPELQPGSGSWDPALGAAATYEPGRWRFNAAVLYQRNGKGSQDYKAGDEIFAELAAGNRFWLEPYPGPFMRLDVLLRYRNQDRATLGGSPIDDSGHEIVTAGANLAFRPRPSLDFQVYFEVPVYQHHNGIQLEEDWSVILFFGFRI